MAETALKEAFRRVGVKSAEDRLRDIALKAMVAHAGNMNTAVEQIWAEVQEDRHLTAELFKLDYRRAISGLIYRVRNAITSAENAGQLKRKVERQAAAVFADWKREEDAEEAADRKSQAEHEAKQKLEYEAYLAKWRETKIGGIEISGMPIWQVSVGKARNWLATQKQRWRTVELLIEGLPNDGRPIEYYRKPDEVEALWQLAGE